MEDIKVNASTMDESKYFKITLTNKTDLQVKDFSFFDANKSIANVLNKTVLPYRNIEIEYPEGYNSLLIDLLTHQYRIGLTKIYSSKDIKEYGSLLIQNTNIFGSCHYRTFSLDNQDFKTQIIELEYLFVLNQNTKLTFGIIPPKSTIECLFFIGEIQSKNTING